MFFSKDILYNLFLTAGPDYGIGIVGKYLGPMTSKRPTKDGWIIC